VFAAFTPSSSSFAASSGSVTVTLAKADTTTVLTAVPNPTAAGQDATFTGAVMAKPPGAGTPTGQVQFADRGGPVFDLVGLDAAGDASTVAFAFAGLYTVDANYLGDAHFNSSSGSVDTRVNKAATTTTLTISPNPATPGATISFSAIVNVLPPGDVQPRGSLQFAIDGAPVGAAIGLGNGVIGYQGSLTAPPGNRTYLVAVSYSGDDDTEPSSTSVTALTTTIQRLTVPGPGVLEQKVYSPTLPKAAGAVAKKPVMIAFGRHRFPAAGAGTLRLKLTSAPAEHSGTRGR
jgi:hypothetical protein